MGSAPAVPQQKRSSCKTLLSSFFIAVDCHTCYTVFQQTRNTIGGTDSRYTASIAQQKAGKVLSSAQLRISGPPSCSLPEELQQDIPLGIEGFVEVPSVTEDAVFLGINLVKMIPVHGICFGKPPE